MTKKQISAYMSKLGRIGGTNSRRTLTSEQAKAMVAKRIKNRKQKVASPPTL